jgi:protein-tyrosine phosphatase
MTIGRVIMAMALMVPSLPALAVTDGAVERSAPDRLSVTWAAVGPVDVFVSERPDATVKSATLVSRGDSDGRFDYAEPDAKRRYFLLRDGRAVVRVAERVIPLERGSNFRDLGGYAAAGGKHVRWGLIYRSAATPMLSEADVARVTGLGVHDIVDFRSSEERLLAPTRLRGIRYTAIDYPMMTMMQSGAQRFSNGASLYRNFPKFLAPQLRVVFDDLLRNEGPVVYHCTAGQDRTGFATAMVLSALGVPRATVTADYHLSTTYRRPEFEMDKIDPALAASNPVAGLFASYQKSGAPAKPTPLKEADGTAFLDGAFAEIEAKWGSVPAYLEAEVGVGKADLARLRLLYLE